MSKTMTENGELHNWTTFAITMIIALRLKYEDNSASPAPTFVNQANEGSPSRCALIYVGGVL